MATNRVRTYSEMASLKTFEERYAYLRLAGTVAADTFGFDRYINQDLYRSKEWEQVRNQVIVRDKACDLGVDGHELRGKILVHHLNPIGVKDISQATEYLLNPEYLVCTSHDTHNAIHYGDAKLLEKNKVIDRKANDTCPWKKK